MCDDSAKKYDVIKSSTLGCDAETDQTKLMQLSFKSAPSAEKHNVLKSSTMGCNAGIALR